MPVSINHTSSYLPVTSPSKATYRHHCSPSSYKSSYSTLSDKYSFPSSRYSTYSRTSSLSDDSGLSITGTSCARDRSNDSQDSSLSRYSKVRSSSSSDSSSPALKSYSSSTLSRKSTSSSRYHNDFNDISVADIRLRFSSLPKTDSVRPTKLSESRSYTRSESLQPLALSSRKSGLSTTLEQLSGSCDEVNDENHNSLSSEDDNANLDDSFGSLAFSDESQYDDQYDQVVPDNTLNLSNSPVKQSQGVGKSIESIHEEQTENKRKAEEYAEPAIRSRSKTDDDLPQLLEQDGSYSKEPVKSSPLSSALATTAVPPTGGLNGLRNIGNTCFLNSVVQCLSNTPQLKEYFVSGAYASEINSENRGLLVKSFAELLKNLQDEEAGVFTTDLEIDIESSAFADLIKDLSQGENKSINTTSFKSQIQRFAPRFMGYSQQDAQEFLRYLLEGLHEDVNRVRVKPKDHVQIDDNLSEQQKALESWKQYLRYDNSKIVDLFGGQLKSTLKCTFCQHSSTTYEVFWDLSLPFPSRTGSITLNQCLELFTRKEELDGDEMPTCSNCKVRRKCTKALTIQKLPTILVLHLKRFNPERLLRKLSANVDFPLTDLDVSPYMDSTARGGTPLYNLYAVSNHSGSAHSGHYTAYCRQPRSDTWYHFNDTRVSPIATRHVVSSEAYLLFYHQNGQYC